MGLDSFSKKYKGFLMTPESEDGSPDSQNKEVVLEDDLKTRATDVADLKLPEKISELLGYGAVQSPDQREALMAVPLLKSRQVLLLKQINALDNALDTKKASADIRESVAFINKLHLKIKTELQARSKKPYKSTDSVISDNEKLVQKKQQEQNKEQLRDLKKRVQTVFLTHRDIRDQFNTGWNERFGGSWSTAQEGDEYNVLSRSIPMLVKEVERYEMLAKRRVLTGGVSEMNSVLDAKRASVNPDEMTAQREVSEVSVFSRMRNRYMMIKEEVSQAVTADTSQKNTPEYESFQRLVRKVEPFLKDADSITRNYSLIKAFTEMMEREALKITGTKHLILPENQSVENVPTVTESAAQQHLKNNLHSPKRLQEQEEQMQVSTDERAQEDELQDVRKATSVANAPAILQPTTEHTLVADASKTVTPETELPASDIKFKESVPEVKKTGWWNKTFLETQNTPKTATVDDSHQQVDVASSSEIADDRSMKGIESHSTIASGPGNRAEEDRINDEIDAQEAKFNYDQQTPAEQRNQEAFDAQNKSSEGTTISIDTRGGDVLGAVGVGNSIGGSVSKSEGASMASGHVPLEKETVSAKPIESVEPATPVEAAATELKPAPVSSVEVQSSAPSVIEKEVLASNTEDLPALVLTEKQRINDVITDGYVEPDMGAIGQEDWKQVSPDTTAIPSDTDIGEGYVEPDMNIIGQEAWKQVSSEEKNDSVEKAPTMKLFGMNIPKAGPEGVHGARSFGKALEIPKHRFSAMGSEDAKMTIAKLDEAISLTRSVPDSGLTSEQVAQLEVLTNEIGMPENYVTYSKILRATEASLDKRATATAAEKLPAAALLVSKEKNSRKSGAMRTLGLATLLSVWPTAAGDGELRNANGALIDTAPSVASASEFSGATGQSSKTIESNTGITADSLPTPEATSVLPQEPRTPTMPSEPVSVAYPEENSNAENFESLDEGPSVVEQQVENLLSQIENDAQFEGPAPKVEYTFTGERNSRGEVIDTVSEAALEMWKRQPEMISSKVTTSQFLAKMWSTIAAIEADPIRNASVLKDMEVASFSNDIDLVNTRQTIDLRRLFVEMNK
jgi:hypothetical protein